MGELLRVTDASFGYGNGANQILIVSGVSFSVLTGDFLLLVGPNGCGKSSIIRGLFGLVNCCAGSVEWRIEKSEIGYIPQESSLDHDIPATALDVVRTAQPSGWSTNRDAAIEALSIVGMEQFAATKFGALSGGQKRRVLLVRALLGKPKLLVLDEPTVNTDCETKARIERVLTDLCAKGEVGIVASTHAEHWAPGATRYRLEGRCRID